MSFASELYVEASLATYHFVDFTIFLAFSVFFCIMSVMATFMFSYNSPLSMFAFSSDWKIPPASSRELFSTWWMLLVCFYDGKDLLSSSVVPGTFTGCIRLCWQLWYFWVWKALAPAALHALSCIKKFPRCPNGGGFVSNLFLFFCSFQDIFSFCSWTVFFIICCKAFLFCSCLFDVLYTPYIERDFSSLRDAYPMILLKMFSIHFAWNSSPPFMVTIRKFYFFHRIPEFINLLFIFLKIIIENNQVCRCI